MRSDLEKYKKIILVILDGFGIASASDGNAVTNVKIPNIDNFVNNYPSLTLQAAGPNVGLAWGEPGNSEVGHACIGAGRIVLQDMPRVNAAISSGEFYKNPTFLAAFDHVKKHNSTLHFIGLLGEGGVHASQQHLHALLQFAAEKGITNMVVHAITDGRDTDPDLGLTNIKKLEQQLIALEAGQIATVTGRFYAMDRAEHWDLTEAAYRAIALGEGEQADSPIEAIERNYNKGVFDETIPPTVISNAGHEPKVLQPNDAVIMCNFRPDRAIQLAQAIFDVNKAGFTNKYTNLPNIFLASMTEYSPDLDIKVAFPKVEIKNNLSKVFSDGGLKQYHISEKEKYAHVTFFFDNGLRKPNKGEEWEIMSSNENYQDRYQNVPEMAAGSLTAKLIEKLNADFDFYLVNYANPDMVGHTGNYEASKKAVEAVDQNLGKLFDEVKKRGDTLMLITGDHGNVEELKKTRTGEMVTNHTTNPVPFLLVAPGLELKKPRSKGYLYLPTQVPEGLLSDIAPTLLEMFGLTTPSEMTGVSLLDKFGSQN